MSTTELKARIQLKADTTANWNTSSLLPKKGELIAYVDSDRTRIKIGDDTTALNSLPFVGDKYFLPLSGGSMDQGSSLSVGGLTVRSNSTFQNTLNLTIGNLYVQGQGSNVHRIATTKLDGYGGAIETGTLKLKKYFGNKENNATDPVSGWPLVQFFVTDTCNTSLGQTGTNYYKTGGIYLPNNAADNLYHRLYFEITSLDTSTNLPSPYAENYWFPVITKDLTADRDYSILTTKDALSYTTNGQNYKVQRDSATGGLYVNVPWIDNNSNYYHTPDYTTGLKIATGTGIGDLYVPESSTTTAGLINATDKVKLNKIPNITSSDNGKFLVIENETIITKTVPDAEENYF